MLLRENIALVSLCCISTVPKLGFIPKRHFETNFAYEKCNTDIIKYI